MSLALLIVACAQVAPPDGGDAANRAPSAPTLEVLPDQPVAGQDDLVCTAVTDAVDPDGDALAWSWSWTVDGVPAAVSGDTVDAASIAPGQSWSCSAEVSDGERTVGAAAEPVEVVQWTELDQWDEPEVTITPDPLVPGEPALVHYEGRLSGEDTVILVYGFNGWSELQSGGSTFDEQTDTVAYYGHELEMTAVDGGFEAEILLPEGTESLHAWFESAEGSIDDDGGREYHASSTFPYIGPYLTWADGAGPSDGIVVSWETRTPSLGAVAWGTGSLDRIAVGTEVDTLHHATLSGLEPATTYTYQVLDSTGLASEQFSFSTAEADAASFRFVAASDMQDANDGTGRWPLIAGAILTDQQPDFVFLPGDLAADDLPGFWWLFFRGGRDLFARVPAVPILGNHDTPGVRSDPDTSSFCRYFELPQGAGTEEYYAVEYGRTLLVALSTEDAETLEEGAAQWTWLEQTLAASWDGDQRRYDHVFVGYHHPSYDAGKRFGGEADDWRGFTELFDFQVDWVFTAHEHMYQRFMPMTYDALLGDEYGIGAKDGVGYLVLPSAGSYLYADIVLPDSGAAYQRDLLAWPEIEDQTRSVDVEHGYVLVEVSGEAVTLSSVSMGTLGAATEPTVIDQITTVAR